MRWLAGLSLCAAAAAQASGQPPGPQAAEAAPRPHVDTPAVRDQRLYIVRSERAEVQGKLTMAVNDLPSARDQPEALKAVARLQGDLQALDNEIRRVESLPAASSSPNGAPNRPAAQASNPVTPSSKASGDSEPWDVFKDFAKKGTP